LCFARIDKTWRSTERPLNDKSPGQSGRSSQTGFKSRAASSTDKLHPSWAASKKRKEQQSKIQESQGKRTVFDSD